MKLSNKSQLDNDIEMLEASASQSLSIIVAAAITLNNSYRSSWNLPDNRLEPLLQRLLDDNKLEEVFTKHHIAATALNTILEAEESTSQRAIAVAGREFTITNGIVKLIPLSSPDPDAKPEPELEP